MPAQIKNDRPSRVRAPRARQQTHPTAADASRATTGRTSDGRFAKDNPGGPGNPHARHCARMRSLPARVGNDIARIALPSVAQARKEALASRFVDKQPFAHKPAQETVVTTENQQQAAPIPVGNSKLKREVGRRGEEARVDPCVRPPEVRETPIPNPDAGTNRAKKPKSTMVRPKEPKLHVVGQRACHADTSGSHIRR
jgi:hypothetical protein